MSDDNRGEGRQEEAGASATGPRAGECVAPEGEQAAESMAFEYPAYGQLRVSNESKKQRMFISPAGVQGIRLRHELETFPKRLRAGGEGGAGKPSANGGAADGDRADEGEAGRR